MSQSILLIVLASAALDAVMHMFLKAEGDSRGMSVRGFVWLREPARPVHALGVVIIAGGAGMMHFAG